MFTRTRYQNGSLQSKARADGEQMWEFRYYETDSSGQRQRRAVTVGSLKEFASESAARKSAEVQAMLLRINAEKPQTAITPPRFGAVIAKYETEEMPERHSTSTSYKSYLKNHIRPRWADTPITGVKTMAVENWLKTLDLAPKSRGNIRSLMHTIFECAERWELLDKNPITLVR